MSVKTIASTFICGALCWAAAAQNPDSDQQSAQMIKDSVAAPVSELVANLGFDSRALVAGRDFDVPQYALMPGLNFYHHSGAFAGLSGSLLSDADPRYTQTTLQAGYGRGWGERWYTSLTAQHFVFNPAAEGLLQNAVALFANYSAGPVSMGASYTVLFDPEKAQQLNFSLSGFFPVKRLKKVEASFLPSASLLIGTETVTLQRFSDGIFRQGTGKPWQDRVPVRPPGPGVPRPENTDTQIRPLSLSIGLPLSLQKGRFGLTLSANYVRPFPSDSETESLSNTLFFSASCAWTLLRKPKKQG